MDDRRFMDWARTASAFALRKKIAELIRQKDFPEWKRVVLNRALLRALGVDGNSLT